MKKMLRRIIRKNYRKILREEVVNREYEYKKHMTDDAFFSKEVEPQEDSWAGGQNIHHQLDHGEVTGSGSNTRGIEVLRITENKLRRMIRRLIIESEDESKKEDDENLLIEPDVNEDRENDQAQYDKQKDENCSAHIDEYSSLGGGSIRGVQTRAFDPDPEKPKG